jgi:hypothetical protein
MSATTKSALSECRSKALSAIDTVLRERPQSLQPAVLELTRAVVALRDTLIEARRTGDATAKRELPHVNALLSLVVSIQYPMQGLHWDKLKQARDAFEKLATEAGAGAGSGGD